MKDCSVHTLILDNANSYVNDRGKPIVDGQLVIDKKYFGLFAQEYSRKIKDQLGVSIEGDVVTTQPSYTKSLRPDVYGQTRTYEVDRWFYNSPVVNVLEKRRQELVKVVDLAENLDSIAAIGLKDISTVKDALFEIAEQLKASPSEAITARNAVGNEIADIALKIFPGTTSPSVSTTEQLEQKVLEEQGQYKLFQIKTIFNSINELNTKLKPINKKVSAIGSDKNIDDTLKKAGVDADLRKQFLTLLQENPELKAFKIGDVLSLYLKQFEKDTNEQFYKAILEPVNEGLESLLKKYFDRFYINTVELDNLKEKFGVDSTGVFDVLNKTVYYANNRNLLTLPEEYGHVFVELLGSVSGRKSQNPLFDYLYDNIETWDGYERVYESYKNLYVNHKGLPDVPRIKKEAIGQAIGLALVRNYEQLEGSPETKTFWQKIKEAINFVLDLIKGIDYVSLNTAADSIARDILNNNYKKLDRLLKDTSNYNLLSYSETIKTQNQKDGGKALKFMQWFCEKGMIITGSLSYRLQGETFRPEIDALHDIDNVVPLEVHNLFIYPEMFSQQIQDTLEPSLTTGTLRINAEKLSKKIPVLRELKQEFPDTDFMYAYTNTKQGNSFLTINAIWSENQELKNRFKSYTGSFNDRLAKFTEKELNQIYLFDFFLTPRLSSDYITIVDQDYNLTLNHFAESFAEKQGTMGRPKDAYDYQRWKPFQGTIPAPIDFKSNLTYFQLSQKRLSTDSKRLKTAKKLEEITKDYDEQDLKNNDVVLVHSLEGLTVENTPESIENLLNSIENGENVYLSTFPTRAPNAPLKERYDSEYNELENRYETIYKKDGKYYHIPYDSDFHINKDRNEIKEITYQEYEQLAEKLEPTFLIGDDKNYIMISPNKGDVKWATFSDVNSRYIDYKGEQIPYPTSTNMIMDSLSYLRRDAYNSYALEWPEAVTKVTKENIVKFVYKGKTIIDNTEGTQETQEALEEFKSQNSNMPDEDIEDYFASCKL